MRFNPLTSFAAGILLATSVSSIAYFSTKSEAADIAGKAPDKVTVVESRLTEEEMKAELQASGYIVQTTAEYDENIEEIRTALQNEKSEDEKKVVYRVVINVTDGMTSIDVGKMLVKAKIVEDAFKFSKAVEKKKVENKLRPGSYEVDSDMTQDEVIAAIFK